MTLLPQDYFRTLGAIRDQCYKVYDKAQANQLVYFDVDESKLPAVVDQVVQVTQRRFSDFSAIPPHSRLRHFDQVYDAWREGKSGIAFAKQLVDLVIVSVLLDAGAGSEWKYKTRYGRQIGRSEGLAVASVDMFLDGYFSSDSNEKDRVDAQGLAKLTVERMAAGFQVTPSNPMVGLEGRSNLLKRLGQVLTEQDTYFGGDVPRPGNMIDYLLKHTDQQKVPIEKLWEAVMSLGGIWPARVEIEGVKLGDVWPCACLNNELVPFHKLSQWLTYSLVEVIESTLGLTVEGVEKMTGLPEYRNGGLLIDHGVLRLKPEQLKRGLENNAGGDLPVFDGYDPLIAEWRALTVVYLDKIHKELETRFNQKLKLAQVLESGTWTAGREIAAQLRPSTGGPPIIIQSDGTLF